MNEAILGDETIPPWKKKACNSSVVVWNDVATAFWQGLDGPGQQKLAELEDDFCAQMKDLFEQHWSPPA